MTNDIRITPATEADISLLRDMAHATFYPTYRAILSPGQLDYMYDWMYSEESLTRQMREGHRFFIAYDGAGHALGYVSIEPQGERLVHLQKIYVCPDCQGRRVGRALIERAFEEARRLFPDGHGRVELNVNRQNPALDFYRHMGMHIAMSGDFDIGNGYFMNDYIMAIDF